MNKDEKWLPESLDNFTFTNTFFGSKDVCFLLILKEIEIFSQASKIIVVPRHCVYYATCISQLWLNQSLNYLGSISIPLRKLWYLDWYKHLVAKNKILFYNTFIYMSEYKLNFIDQCMGLPYSSDGKESACNAEDLGSIPGSGRSSGERNGNPLQYSCLEKPTDRGAWWAIVHGVSRSQTQLEWLSAYTADKALRPAACLNWSISEQPSISSCSEMSSESWSWCLSLVWLQG